MGESSTLPSSKPGPQGEISRWTQQRIYRKATDIKATISVKNKINNDDEILQEVDALYKTTLRIPTIESNNSINTLQSKQKFTINCQYVIPIQRSEYLQQGIDAMQRLLRLKTLCPDPFSQDYHWYCQVLNFMRI